MTARKHTENDWSIQQIVGISDKVRTIFNIAEKAVQTRAAENKDLERMGASLAIALVDSEEVCVGTKGDVTCYLVIQDTLGNRKVVQVTPRMGIAFDECQKANPGPQGIRDAFTIETSVTRGGKVPNNLENFYDLEYYNQAAIASDVGNSNYKPLIFRFPREGEIKTLDGAVSGRVTALYMSTDGTNTIPWDERELMMKNHTDPGEIVKKSKDGIEGKNSDQNRVAIRHKGDDRTSAMIEFIRIQPESIIISTTAQEETLQTNDTLNTRMIDITAFLEEEARKSK